MIIIKLKGGLGNQMFQYACARSLINEKEKVFLDIEFLEKNNSSSECFTSKNYELGIFKNCRIRFLSDLQRKIIYDKRLRYKIFRKLILGHIFNLQQIENEYIQINKSFRNIYLDGYFQSEKYFNSIRKSIIKEFTFPVLDDKNKIIHNQILKEENPVSVHIRRGDYLKKQVYEYHGILPLSYYLKSIEELKRQYSNLIFYFFSDDIAFVRSNFNHINNKVIVEGNTGKDNWKDIFLMTSCKHHIIANSSFSWWGAWLSLRSGIRIAPQKWFIPSAAKFDINNIVPNDWMILD